MGGRRRGERADTTPGPRDRGNWLRTPQGAPRGGWLLVAGLLGYIALQWAATLWMRRGFVALFQAWGVNAETVRRAPHWARLVYRWHGSFITLVVSAALLLLACGLRRYWLGRGEALRFDGRRLARAALAGLIAAIAVTALGLIFDSLRPEWPLSAPRLSWGLIPLCAVSLVAVWAGEALTKRALLDGLSAHWGRCWALVAVCALFFVGSGGYAGSVVSAVNVALTGLLTCLLYERFGLWAAVGLRWGWSAATLFLLGYGGGGSAVYRFYGVSEYWLAGGDAGPMFGLWTTLLLVGALAWLERKRFAGLLKGKKAKEI